MIVPIGGRGHSGVHYHFGRRRTARSHPGTSWTIRCHSARVPKEADISYGVSHRNAAHIPRKGATSGHILLESCTCSFLGLTRCQSYRRWAFICLQSLRIAVTLKLVLVMRATTLFTSGEAALVHRQSPQTSAPFSFSAAWQPLPQQSHHLSATALQEETTICELR